jgi:hypothetical protein
MNNLNSIQHPDFGKIRAEVLENDVWFCANDVCRALGFSNPRGTVNYHCFDGDVKKIYILTDGGRQLVNFVNESGLYALIFNSEKELAKRFKQWVTSEVLPSIRRHGFYQKEPEGQKKALKGTGGENLAVVRLLNMVDAFLLKGDKKNVAREIGVSQQAINSVIHGHHRSPRILSALFERAMENSRRVNGNLYLSPERAIEQLINPKKKRSCQG